jgi:hypothetical protein
MTSAIDTWSSRRLILYQAPDGRTRIEYRSIENSLWPSQALLAELFQVTASVARCR